MAIQLEITVYGGQLGARLACDAEETAYALEALARETEEDFAAEVADHVPFGQAQIIGRFLRRLADAVEAVA